MTHRLRRVGSGRRKWLVIASAIAVSSYVAGGQAAHSLKSPAVPANPPDAGGHRRGPMAMVRAMPGPSPSS